MANDAAVLTDSKQADQGRLIIGIVLGVCAVILINVLPFSPELLRVPLKYVCVALALTCLTGAGSFLLDGTTIRWPVRLMKAMFILCLLAFLGTLIWWMVVAG